MDASNQNTQQGNDFTLRSKQAGLYFAIRIILVGAAAALWLITVSRISDNARFSPTALVCYAFVCLVCIAGFCKAFRCFDLGWARIRDLIAWYTLSLVLSDCVLFAVYLLVARSLQGAIALLLTGLVQVVCGAATIVLFNRLYYRITPVQSICAFIAGLEYEELTLVKLAKKTERFSVRAVYNEQDVTPEDYSSRMEGCNTIVLGDVRPELRKAVLRDSYLSGHQVILIPTISEILFSGYKPLQIADSLLIAESNVGLTLEQRVIKRAVDIVGSIVGLVISAIPIAVCAIIIKATDGGSVFYKQERLTRDGRVFTAYKLRSMSMDAEKNGAQLTVPGDNRVTRIGSFMRRRRLDETPQFWNVLIGDMSLCGPRSERVETSEAYTKADPSFAYRLKVKTGMTGYAQIHGYYNTSYEDKLRMDLYYIQHWSFIGDFALLLETLKVIFSSEATTGFETADIGDLVHAADATGVKVG